MFVFFLLGSAVAYNIVMIIYRLYFHKLSRFPGPRLAAATGLYEIYFSAWGPGIFEYEIDNMHRKFGMPSDIYVKKKKKLLNLTISRPCCSYYSRWGSHPRAVRDFQLFRWLDQRYQRTGIWPLSRSQRPWFPVQETINLSSTISTPGRGQSYYQHLDRETSSA